MSVRRLCSAVLMLGAVLASPVQALGLLEAYDLAVRNDPIFQAAIEELSLIHI